MRKLVWSSDPARPRDERRDLAFEAWRAAAEHLRPELFTLANDRLDAVNEIYAAFSEWWKVQIQQCLYIIPDGDGGWSCVLQAGHDGDHCPSDDVKKYVAPDATWILPEHLAWRQRRLKQQP